LEQIFFQNVVVFKRKILNELSTYCLFLCHIKKLKLKVLLLTLFFLFTQLILAQSKAILNGIVKSSNSGKAVASNLIISNEDVNFAISTDSMGKFSCKIPKGKIKIEINQINYLNESLIVDIQKDTLLIFFLKENNFELKEVLISNQTIKPISISTGGKLSFNPQKLATIPSLTGSPDIIKLLQLTPGVQNSGDANGYLYVRGGDPGHNLMLYADTPIYGMSHLLGIFPFYNSDHVQEVQFDKSNSNSKYGGRLSSTLAVIPYRDIPKDLSVQGSLGLLASQLTISVPITNSTGLFISGRKTYIDEIVAPIFYSKKGNKNENGEGFTYGFGDSNITFISKLSQKSLFTFDVFLSDDKFGVKDPNLSLTANLKWNNIAFTPNWKYQISEKTTLQNSLFFTKYENNLQVQQAGVGINVSSYIQDFGYTNSVVYYLKQIPFESGLQYTHHNLQPQKIEISNLSIENRDSVTREINADEIVVYTSAKPRIAKNIFAELGLRLNYYTSDSQTTTFLRLEPRIVVNYVNKKYSFFASYTRQNQFINLVTTSSVGVPTDFWIASSDGIPASSSDEFSIGYNQVLGKQLNLSLNGYYNDMNKIIEYPFGLTQFNEITTLKNDILIGDGNAYGLELMLKKDKGKFKGWFSYTLSWSIREIDSFNNGDWFYSKYDRRNNFSLTGAYDFNKKWNIGLTQILSSGNRFTMPTSWYFVNNNPVKEYGEYNNAQLPKYIRTDISVNYYFFKTAKKESALNFSIFNTFNIDNPIYVVLSINVDDDKVSVKTDEKKMYSILPSISWRFKF